MQGGTEMLEKFGLQFLTKKYNSRFSKFRLTRCSEVLGDVPRVLRDIFCKFSWDFTVNVAVVEGGC